MTNSKNKEFDVIILGSGLGGSLLATILARHNARVLMIDKETHPKFAVGEAMTPDTDLMMKVLSYEYDVPELAHLSSFHNIYQNISPSACGLKRQFGFVYHREGKEQLPQETTQVGVVDSSHLFRQDIDSRMVQVAIQYGTKFLPKTKVVDLDIDATRVAVKVENGEEFTAEFLVDASGDNSLLASKFNLRENPTRLKTHSRSIFTHAIGVENYDDFLPDKGKKSKLIPWYQGTLHHIFDGGWMWVIPFNNHKTSKNSVCSIGLNLDPRRFPKTNLPPEAEFQNFLNQFPSIGIQFKNAKPIRECVSTNRLQYSSHSCMGERFYVVPHAAGFVDALFSFGLVTICTIINPLAYRLLKAIAEKDFSTQHFAPIENLQQKLLNHNDDLVNCSYIAFRNFNLWDAWRRVWILGSFLRQSKVRMPQVSQIAAGKARDLVNFNELDDLECLTPSFEGVGEEFFQDVVATLEKVERGLLSPDDAASVLMLSIQSIDFLPKILLKLGDVSRKHLDLKSLDAFYEGLRFLFWVKTSPKPEAKKYFDFKVKDMAHYLLVNQ